jgi:hypothetical protein
MKRRYIWVFLIMTLALLIGTVLAAYPTGYTLETTGTGTAAISQDFSHSTPNSVKMATVVGPVDKAAIVFNGGPTLGSIASLSYWTYTMQAGTFNQLTAWIAIYLHTQPGKTFTDWYNDYLASSPNVYYLQAEPYYTYSDHGGGPDILPTLNMWVKWDAFDPVMPFEWESLEEIGGPHSAPTLAQYIAGAVPNYSSREYGSLYVCAIKIRMGYGGPWVNTLAYVDDVTISDYFENFDPPVPPLPPSVGGFDPPFNTLGIRAPGSRLEMFAFVIPLGAAVATFVLFKHKKYRRSNK